MSVFGKAQTLIIAAVAAACSSAQAGLVRAAVEPCTEAGPPAWSAASAAVPAAERLAGINWLVAHQSPAFPRTPHAITYRTTPSEPAAEALVALPPAPSSLALVLSALAGVGAYHGVRSLKRLHFAFVPDWYHTDAAQVGHVTPLQLEFDWSALPACALASPSDLQPQVSYRIQRERRSRFESRPLVPTCSPRSPPIFS